MLYSDTWNARWLEAEFWCESNVRGYASMDVLHQDVEKILWTHRNSQPTLVGWNLLEAREDFQALTNRLSDLVKL
jgi:hypothetical protein